MPSTPLAAPARDLLLIGGGHAQVHVLEDLAARPIPGLRLHLVADFEQAIYSGMVPGFVAGQYQVEDLRIDLRAWAQRLGATLVLGRAVSFDAEAQQVTLADGRKLGYDYCSWNIGSTIVGKALPGVQKHALCSRPIGALVEGIERELPQWVTRARNQQRAFRVVVVGNGAAGVELALCLEARLRHELPATPPQVTLVGAQPPLPGASPRLARLVRRELLRRKIALRNHSRAIAVRSDAVELRNAQGEEESLAADLCLWVTGAAPHLQEPGWIPVGPTLQHPQHPELFATGDCAQLLHAPDTPKAGVYAVREGPILAHNLRTLLTVSVPEAPALQEYQPQADFLTLLNFGDGRGAGARNGIAFRGRWVQRWKDRIDRRFLARFQP